MMKAIQPPERTYINNHWRPKERQVIRCYTSLNPNLNCFSSQREEGQHPMVKTVLNHQIRLDRAVERLGKEMELAVIRLQTAEQVDKAHNRRVLEQNSWYLIREVVASWPLVVVEKEWTQLAKFRATGEALPQPCRCGLIERFGLPCAHSLERAWDEHLPLPLTLIHSRWWYRGGVESRVDWRPTYSDQPQLGGQTLTIERPNLDIVNATNELLAYRETLTREQQDLLDEHQVRSTAQILSDARLRQHVSTTIPRSLPPPIPTTWNRHAKSHDKVATRMMTGAEVAVREVDKQEAAEKAAKKKVAKEKLTQEKAVKAKTQEAAIDDELLGGMASDGSEVNEIVFSRLISPPRRVLLPSPRPITPEAEAARKRSFTLVHRTPDKPRAAPVAPTTPSALCEASPVSLTPQEPVEIPASTAPARLDGRPRREGKNSVYEKVMAIERGRGRGGRGGQRGGEA
jgi:hypothetical protein